MTLIRQSVSLLDRATGWADLIPEERRRRAVLAVRDRDDAALWSLTEAYLTLHGASGTATSPRTLKAYRWAVMKFLTYAGTSAVNLLRATTSDGLRFIRTVEAQGLSASSTRVQLAGARLLYRALNWADATPANPFGNVKPVRDKTAAWDKRSPYTDAEVELLLCGADSRMRTLLLLCAHGGLRISEALALEEGDVSGGELVVRSGKGGKQRRVALSGRLREVLVRSRSPGAVVGGSYPAAVERLQRLCLKQGVTYRGYHALRHYAGTRLVREGASLEEVARHLGHSVLETTRIYTKWGDEGLRRQLGDW